MTQISFIVSVDHQAGQLDAMLKALRRQGDEYSSEFIFVDDGSDDGSYRALIERTQTWPRTMLIQQKPQGPTAAALTGAKAATGDFLMFLDGDTVLAPGAAGFLMTCMKANDIDMLLAGHVWTDDAAAFAPEMPKEIPDIEPIEHATLAFLRAAAEPPHRLMARRSAFRDPGFFDAAVYLPDFAPPLYASPSRRIARLPLTVSAAARDATSAQRRRDGQAEYDLSATVAGFLAASPDLPAACRKAALRGCVRRAWRWRRQVYGASLTSRFFWLYIKALLGVPMDIPAAVADSLTAWDGEAIRRPPVGKP